MSEPYHDASGLTNLVATIGKLGAAIDVEKG